MAHHINDALMYDILFNQLEDEVKNSSLSDSEKVDANLALQLIRTLVLDRITIDNGLICFLASALIKAEKYSGLKSIIDNNVKWHYIYPDDKQINDFKQMVKDHLTEATNKTPYTPEQNTITSNADKFYKYYYRKM